MPKKINKMGKNVRIPIYCTALANAFEVNMSKAFGETIESMLLIHQDIAESLCLDGLTGEIRDNAEMAIAEIANVVCNSAAAQRINAARVFFMNYGEAQQRFCLFEPPGTVTTTLTIPVDLGLSLSSIDVPITKIATSGILKEVVQAACNNDPHGDITFDLMYEAEDLIEAIKYGVIARFEKGFNADDVAFY